MDKLDLINLGFRQIPVPERGEDVMGLNLGRQSLLLVYNVGTNTEHMYVSQVNGHIGPDDEDDSDPKFNKQTICFHCVDAEGPLHKDKVVKVIDVLLLDKLRPAYYARNEGNSSDTDR